MRILILGTGAAQSDLIEFCKAMGFEAIGCSNSPDDKWIKKLDRYEYADIKDRQAVLEIARKYNVDLIYTIGSAVAMPSVAEVSEKLGLPCFISVETAETCVSKERLRGLLGAEQEGNLQYEVYTGMEDALTCSVFPAMMKPVDSQGQRGCFRVDSKEDIRKYFDLSLSYSPTGRVIIEEYVEGEEVSVNAYMQDGDLKLCIITDRITYDEFPGGIIREHRIPSRVISRPGRKDTAAKIRQLVVHTADRLGIKNGPAYFQIIVRNNGDPALIEADARLDGCHLWRLIRYYCGIDLIDMSIRHLTGNDCADFTGMEGSETGYVLKFISEEPGKRFSTEKTDESEAEYVCLYYDEGDIVIKKNGHYEKCGYIIEKM